MKVKTVFDLLEKQQRNPNIAIIDDTVTLTYKDLYCSSLNLGNELLKLYPFNQNIGVFIENSTLFVIAYFAIASIGGCIVPIDTNMKANELKSFIKNADIDLILTNTTHFDCSVFEHLKVKIFNISSISTKITNCSQVERKILFNLSSKKNAILIQTSGTLASPKLVMLSHQDIIWNSQAIIKNLKITEADTTLVVLPLRLSCNISQLLTHLTVGASVYIANSHFNAKSVINTIFEQKITNMCVVPPMLYLLNQCLDTTIQHNSDLRFISHSGCPANEHIIAALQMKFPKVDFIETYGMTEAGPRISNIHSFEKSNHPNAVGLPMRGIKIKVVNENNRPTPPNTIGELWIKSPSQTKGYYKNESETRHAFCKKWLKTGDLGFITEQGYIHLTGRKKNLINCGGNKICPEEVEAAIKALSFVVDAYVHAKKLSILGEIVIAEIQIDDTTEPDIAEKKIIEHCEKNLTDYKIPKQILFVKKINKNPSGKTIRR